MTSPVNLSLPVVETNVVPLKQLFITEGNLEGRRVINSTESVNDILNECKKVELENISAQRKNMLGTALTVAGIAGLVVSTVIFSGCILTGVLSGMGVAGIAAAVSAAKVAGYFKVLSAIMWGSFYGGAISLSKGLSLCEKSSHMIAIQVKKNNEKQKLALDAGFLDWAEANKIKLTYSNISNWNVHRLRLQKIYNDFQSLRS